MRDAFTPIWALTLLGYLAGRFRLIGDGADRVLGGFVFHLAMPAALFTTLSGTRLSFSGPAVAAFALGTVVTMAAGFSFSRGLLRRGSGESTIAAMAAGYVNAANLGIPVALHVLGDASFLTGVLLFQVLVITPTILVLLDRGSGRRMHLGRIATLPLRNPVIIGLVLGALSSHFSWRIPEQVADPLSMLGAAAVPAALVALGVSLSVRGTRLAGEHTEVFVLSALKLLLQPGLAYLSGVALGLDPADLLALVVCAALPTAQNCYIFATEYDKGAAVARRVVVTTTAVSMATLAAINWWLG